ncbi:TetR family transcriptional regulator [Undibacterium sp. TS12]|uniref:TetR/AcrR family transcriptional regulator n=1 Tax=Undibacterium sp. TS12 TaxID=2908202 RepID=UPI001F4D21AF|nr:TetR family transcriptional regulator [Undibacterium sp. TS12]MCH8621098.1 TetR family transcriptional regulator [Undibacterium sp. TS12]
MSRRPNTEQRRAEIVQALLATMAEHGYEKATIQLIAQQAGLAPGLLHYHFKTKADMLLELVKTLATLSRQRYLAFAENAVTPEQKLHAYINARLAKGQGSDPKAVAAWVVIGAEAVRQPEVRAVYQQAVEAELRLVEELLTACLQAKGRQLRGVAQLAAGLLAYMEGSFQLASAAPEAMPVGYAAETAIQLLQSYMDAEMHV